jgi:hypothetical protein
MRALLLTAVATASVLRSGISARQADAAMPLGAGFAAGATSHVETIANVCGTNGCVRVQTQRVVKHQKAGNVIPK